VILKKNRNSFTAIAQKSFPMQKIILLLISFIFPLTFLFAQGTINQSDANGHKQGHWIGKFPNGTIRFDGSFVDDKPVGDWKRFHENGKIKASMHHLPNSDKVSAELFDINGVRYAKGNYNVQVKDSTWNYYNNQILVGQENYSDGIKNGKSSTFYENSIPATQSQWFNGMLNGESLSFYSSGKKKTQTQYLKGKRQGITTVYYESGNTQITGQYDNDKSDGNWKFMAEDQKVKFILKYKAGVLLNPEVVDSIQMNEFKAFDRSKGKLKDPENFSQNPDEYLRN
jgi:antitoxin component YwqK of YwqJK toxin-antitoxin module